METGEEKKRKPRTYDTADHSKKYIQRKGKSFAEGGKHQCTECLEQQKSHPLQRIKNAVPPYREDTDPKTKKHKCLVHGGGWPCANKCGARHNKKKGYVCGACRKMAPEQVDRHLLEMMIEDWEQQAQDVEEVMQVDKFYEDFMASQSQ
jgi:hypothetical protein